MERELLIGMVLFMSGAASLFVAAVLGARALRHNGIHVALLLGLGGLSFFLYFTRERSPFWLALAATATVLWVVTPALLALMARSQGRAGRLALARALCLGRYGLTLARPALVQARVYRGFNLEEETGWEGVRAHFLALRREETSPDLRAVVDTAYLGFALRRGDFYGASGYLESLENLTARAGDYPEVAVLALQAYCETGRLEQGAALLRELVKHHPVRVGSPALLAAYTSFLRCAGDEARLDALWNQAGRRAIVRSVPLPPAEGKAADGPTPEIPWPPPLSLDSHPGWQVQAQSLARSPVTAGLVVANALVMVGLLLTGRPESAATLVDWGANATFLVEAGQVWRWGSSVFLHFGTLHIVTNLFALYVIGRLGESMYGPARLLLVYLVAGFAGSVVSTYVSAPPVSAGASGAISGLIGLGFVFTLLHGKNVSLSFRNRYLAVFLFIIGADFVYGISEPMIDNAAHMGGLVAGALVTVLLAPRPAQGAGAPKAFRISLALSLGLVVTAMVACLALAGRNVLSGGPLPPALATRAVAMGPFLVDVPRHWQQEKGREEVVQGVMDATLSGPFELAGIGLEGRDGAERVLGQYVDRELQGTGSHAQGRVLESHGLVKFVFRVEIEQDGLGKVMNLVFLSQGGRWYRFHLFVDPRREGQLASVLEGVLISIRPRP